MSGTTPNGLPYPDPTDPLTEGADAIRALAESVDDALTGALFGGSAVWGTPGPGPVKRIGGYWEGPPDGASAALLNLATGTPWTCILEAQLTPRFKYGDVNWVNAMGCLNVEATTGTATGGQLSFTAVNPTTGTGISGKYTGFAWHITYQD